MSVTLTKSAANQKTEQSLLQIVSSYKAPMRLRDLLDESERLGLEPQQARRSLWTLIDEHRFALGPDNRVSLLDSRQTP